ncbi:hypothetical protein BP6252_13546 [Coleophoma cylindrospora]|uniref:Uncharacterized protein n=1 Tax=Coleophoma cylindrospora TaxID=1849047 RepID=A0A3D8Q8H1_9HELO|nr:hypothetical protein BP6252_13546 [Coleophoma cylindrospora]
MEDSKTVQTTVSDYRDGEVAVRRLPAIDNQGAIASLTSHSENLIPRIASSSSNPAIRTLTATQTTHGSTNTVLYIQSLSVRPVQTCGAGKTCGPNPNEWLDVGTITVVNAQATIRTSSTPSISSTTKSITPSSSFAPAPSNWLTTTAPTVGGPAPTNWLTPPEKQSSIHVFTRRDYFIGAFLPTILAVLFSIPWSLLDATIKEMEPFYQLATPTGVPAADSLFLNYANKTSFLVLFHALFRGRWPVFYSSFAYMLTLALAPLASEAVFIGLSGTCNATAGGQACLATLGIFPTIAKVLQGLLAAMAVLTLGLLVAFWRRSSGVFAEPRSLAGIATLSGNSQICSEFRNIASVNKYSEKHLAKALENKWYRLGWYHTYDGSMAYGFMIDASPRPSINGQSQSASLMPGPPMPPMIYPPPSKKESGVLFRRLQLIFSAIALCVLMAVILYYFLTNEDTTFERFMDSQGFGVRFLFTCIGVAIKKYWEHISKGNPSARFFHVFKTHTSLVLRSQQPYINLAKGQAKAEDSILLDPSMTYASSIWSSIRRGNFFMPLVDVCALLTEVLTVALANIPFSNATTYQGFKFCVYISISILAFMLLTVIIALFRGHSFLKPPLNPETILQKLVYLSESQITYRLGDMGSWNEKDRNKRILFLNNTYSFKTVIGRDGSYKERIDVDEPPHLN